MAYPIDCDKNAENFAACAAYKQKAEEFYQDTVIEIYTSVRLMEQTMAELTAEVENLSSTFTGVGGGGAESGDDETAFGKCVQRIPDHEQHLKADPGNLSHACPV